MKKTILTAILFAMTITLTACGSGGGSPSTSESSSTMLPPGANPSTWKPTATINSVSLASTTYSTATPAPVSINYNISIETTTQGGSVNLHAGLSNSTVVPGVCEPTPITAQYQNLGASLASNLPPLMSYKVDNLTGVMTTSTSNQNNQMIMPTPVNGIDYTQPTFIVFTVCVPDMSKPIVNGVQPYSFSQIAKPITITP